MRTPATRTAWLLVALMAATAMAVPMPEEEETSTLSPKPAAAQKKSKNKNPFSLEDNVKKGGSKQKDKKAEHHPLDDVIVPHDLTLRLPPLKTHEINPPQQLRQHHSVVKKMAASAGFTEAQRKKLDEMLTSNMKEYKVAAERVLKYKKNKNDMSMRDRAKEEHRITEQAKALHHKFYRIKMFALKPGAPTQPFEALREIMKSDKFSAEDRAAFEAEILEHLKIQEDFASIQKERHGKLRVQLGNGKLPSHVYEKHREKVKRHVVETQKHNFEKLKKLRERIMDHAGEL